MVEIIRIIDIVLPLYSEDINKNNFLNFLSWKWDKRNLEDVVIEQFKNSFAESLGYDKESLPTEKIILPKKLGNVEFDAIITPTHKTPSYKDVLVDFESYLGLLLKQYKHNIPRKGVRTIEGEPYLTTSEAINELSRLVSASLKGKEWFKLKLDPKSPPELLEKIPEVVSVIPTADYKNLNESNASLYFKSDLLLKEGEKRTENFMKFLLEYSLKAIGYEPKQITMIPHVFGEMSFIHQIEPRTKTSYSDIIDAFMKEPPKQITTRSRIGDLFLARMVKGEEPGERFLREKGLVDDKFIREYNPVIREDEIYVRLNGIIKKLEFYKSKFTESTIEQNIYFKPNLTHE